MSHAGQQKVDQYGEGRERGFAGKRPQEILSESVIASANTGPRPNQPSPRSEDIEGVDKLNNDCNVSVSSNKLANTPIALLREESSDRATVFKLFDVRL